VVVQPAGPQVAGGCRRFSANPWLTAVK
jgi:hypothetical protein